MRRVRQLIDESLVSRARQMGALTQSLRQLLPPALAPHCRVSGVTPDHLILAADGGNWATQLRYLQREIVKHMNAHHGLSVARVRVQVSAPSPGDEAARSSGTRPARPRPRVPAGAGAVLRETARTLDDPQLAGALKRLAERAGRKS
jgi:hypothetical protein